MLARPDDCTTESLNYLSFFLGLYLYRHVLNHIHHPSPKDTFSDRFWWVILTGTMASTTTGHFLHWEWKTQGSVLNQNFFLDPVCQYSVQTARNAHGAASLLQPCYFAVIKPISGCVCIACSDLMITSLLQVVNRLAARWFLIVLSASLVIVQV